MSRRVAVVTGGAGALGSAVVEALLADGWRVHVPVRRVEDATRSDRPAPSASTGSAGGTLRIARADLADPSAVAAFFEGVALDSGRVDLLANLAGGFAAGRLEETDPESWQRMWQDNATGPFLAVRAALPLLRSAGGGAVVNVAAAAALEGPVAGMSAYLAAKSALVSLTRNLAKELAPEGITVNAVAPGVIDTPANRAAMPGADRSAWVAPEEIAGVIRFLAGPGARAVTGNVIVLRKG